MSEGPALRRRGREVELGGPFVERDHELAVLQDALKRPATDGVGSTIVLEAPAGTGKSRLLVVAGDLAREAGMVVLEATASEPERNFSFGVALQLLERWASIDAAGHAVHAHDSGRLVEQLLTGQSAEKPASTDQGFPLIHGLYSLACNIASVEPLVMLVDAVHWADGPTLRFLEYLAERTPRLPIVLIVTLSPGEPLADQELLNSLAFNPKAMRLNPPPLTPAGVETVVKAEFPDARDAFVDACARVTGGNPGLLIELLAQLRADGRRPDEATAEQLPGNAPKRIVDSVVARLGAMPPDVRALALAVSILGDGASLRHAAQLAGVEPGSAANAADVLASIHLLQPGAPLCFVHPLIRSAVAASIPPLTRGRTHRRAAALLRRDDSPLDAVAEHLMCAPGEGGADAVEVLRTVAQKALTAGSVDSAVRFLERALAEPAVGDLKTDVVAELGLAEALAGLPRATEHLTEAMSRTDSPERRTRLALAQAQVLHAQACYQDAAEVLERAIHDFVANDNNLPLAAELDAAYVAVASRVPELASQAPVRRERLLDRLAVPPLPGQRTALAHVALQEGRRGEPRSSVLKLVDLAWGEGALLREGTAEGTSLRLLTGALLFTDELERAVEICTAARNAAPPEESLLAFATAGYCRAWPLFEQGLVDASAADAEAALDAPDHWQAQVRGAYGAWASCQIARGQHQAAERTLAILDDHEVHATTRYPVLLEIRAQLRLAQHRPAEALADALGAGNWLESRYSATSPGAVAWRSTAALAHLALGEPERAKALAVEELDQAQRIGITRVEIRNLRVLGLVAGGDAGMDLLTRAVRLGDRHPRRLEHIRALIDLGAALRRANQRAAAREMLRRGLELSHGGGATELANRAQTELAAAGARPRRVQLSGVAALTPSERRVADLAVQGLTTRQMAEALFVTPKTVEFHLRHTYRKLDVSSRAELASALNDQD